MKILMVLAITLSGLTTFAKDSTWQICQGKATLFQEQETILVNLFEHRSSSGRVTDMTLIFGGHVLSGSFDSTDADTGSILMKNESSSFKGEVNINYSTNTLLIGGSLNLGTKTNFNTVLKCKVLRD